MKHWYTLVGAVVLSFALLPDDAEARRFGSGRSVGVQRQAAPDKPAAPPSAQQQTAQAQPATPAQSATPAGRPAGRWLGPLVGLAAGIGLAALFGEHLGALLMAGLIAVGVIASVGLLARTFMKSRAAPGMQGLQYAGLGAETVEAPPPSQITPGQTLPDFRSQFTSKIPAGFNVEAFLREARRSFVALQSANDRGDLEAIRDMVTDEMYDHLATEIRDRGAAPQRTDVVALNADLLEVVTEGSAHWASIRFSGLIRESANGAPQQFEEIWNLQKSASGDTGWMLAGIQQVG